MDRPVIVIRDIHRYGDDLTVPEAIARLCGGGPVTVTVTDPAPPGGDPRGNPRHGSGITVRPAAGGPAGAAAARSPGTHRLRDPAGAALFAEALALASQLAGLPGPAAARPSSAARRRSGPPTAGTPPGAPSPAPRPPPAATSPPGSRPATRWSTTCTPRPPWPASTASAPSALDLAGDLGLSPAVDRVLAAAEDASSPPPAKPSGPRPDASPATAPPSTRHASSQRGEA